MLTLEVLARFKEKWARLRCQPTNVETAILSYDDVEDMATIIRFAERVLTLQAQGAKMVNDEVCYEMEAAQCGVDKGDCFEMWESMFLAAPDLLAEGVDHG
jgi:hypothetical protein